MKNGTEFVDARLPYMMIALAFAGTLVAAFLVAGFCDSLGS